MNGLLLTSFVIYVLAGGAAAVNEASHGWVAQQMGVGHQHWIDHGGHHCEAPRGAAMMNGSGHTAEPSMETDCDHHHDDTPAHHRHGEGP